jgi:3-oxoacyl-[acyl-carrier protein] reductase
MAQHTRTALVTGSGRNIGKAIALHLAERGFNVVVNGSRDTAACEAVADGVRERGTEALVAMGDIGDAATVQGIAQAALDRFGGVDVLVANAAIRPDGGFLTVAAADWNRVMDVNFYSVFHLARACIPGMIERGWGRIVTFTGMNAQQGYAGKAAVSVSKHALWGLTKSLSKEFGPQGVTCNIISPGTIPDPEADVSQPPFPALLAKNPAGRLGTGDDIAAVVDLLVSDEGGFINGQMLQINGGVVNQF